jgi:hypothetical protein
MGIAGVTQEKAHIASPVTIITIGGGMRFSMAVTMVASCPGSYRRLNAH